jgi:Uma2 family endonuclease
MNIALQSLMGRPDLPNLVAELNDQLRQEQERRDGFLQDLTPDVKAEFIAGEAIFHSPAKAVQIETTGRLFMLLKMHVTERALGKVLFEKALVHLTRNDYEPDILYFGLEKASRITPEQMLFPAPDFIAEVLSQSTEHRDRGVKFVDYANHGVGEYWLIDTDNRAIEQYRLVDQKYELFQKLKSGSIDSLVVTDFEVPIAAIFDDAHCTTTLRRRD